MPIQLNSRGCGKGNIISGDLGTDGYVPSKETMLNMLKAHGHASYEYLLSLGLENWSVDSFDPSQNQAFITYKNPRTGLEVPTIINLPNPNIPFNNPKSPGGPNDGIAGGSGGGSVILPDGSVYHPPVAFPPGNGECC